MFLRVAGLSVLLLSAACASVQNLGAPKGGDGAGHAAPLAQDKARLRIVRSNEVLALPQRAEIRISGKLVARIDPGEQFVVDLPPGRHAVTATQRRAAPAAPLLLDLAPGGSYRILVTLDPGRFPAYDGPARPLRFLKESIDAPHDDRRSMFRLERHGESPRARARQSAAQAESELDETLTRPADPAAGGR